MNKKKLLEITSKLLTILSSAIICLFLYFVYKLNMLTFKYFLIISIIFFIVNIIFYLIIFNRRTKKIFKKIAVVLILIFSVFLCFGMYYVDKTTNFLHAITGELNQNEEYFLKVLNNNYKSLNDLKNKKIGIYINSDEKNIKVAVDLIKKKIDFEYIEFEDINEMILELENGNIDGVIINELINTLILNELNSTIKLKTIYSVLVPIKSDEITKEVDVTNKTFNVYVAGGDAYGTINKVMNTDVNMVITVNPVKKKILLTSIPRDYYVNLPTKGENAYDKLTHAGYYGIQESVLAVEKLLDIDINYYVKVNFSTIVDVIDAIDGIELYNEISFCAKADPTDCYGQGNIKLNGERSLAFARERYAFKDGDIQRVKNQQKVLTSVVDKISSSSVLITSYLDILDSIKDSFSTNMDTKSMNKLVKMQLKDMSRWNIESQNLISGSGDTLASTYTFPDLQLYVMPQNEESIFNARENIKSF